MKNADRDSKLMRLERCPACAATEREKLFDLDRYCVFECSKCQLRYIDPCLSPEGMQYYYASNERLLELNPFHSSYYDHDDPNASSKTVHDFQKTLAFLESDTIKDQRKLFDVGCGNGLFLAVSKKRGWQVSGCEPSESNVEQANKKFGSNIRCASFDHYATGNEKYSVVSFWDVLEHLAEPHAFIAKAAGMLRPQGKIIAAGPNDLSLLRIMASSIFHLTGGRVSEPLKKAYLLEHVAYYNVRTLTNLFQKHGFVLKRAFLSSTDLEKYHLNPFEKTQAATVLTAGKLLGFQNRMIAVFQVPA